jgi:PDZ domain
MAEEPVATDSAISSQEPPLADSPAGSMMVDIVELPTDDVEVAAQSDSFSRATMEQLEPTETAELEQSVVQCTDEAAAQSTEQESFDRSAENPTETSFENAVENPMEQPTDWPVVESLVVPPAERPSPELHALGTVEIHEILAKETVSVDVDPAAAAADTKTPAGLEEPRVDTEAVEATYAPIAEQLLESREPGEFSIFIEAGPTVMVDAEGAETIASSDAEPEHQPSESLLQLDISTVVEDTPGEPCSIASTPSLSLVLTETFTTEDEAAEQAPAAFTSPSKLITNNGSDPTSQAAMALAAVAAAATANNISPSAAAEAARALAPALVPESATSTLPMKRENQGRREIEFVNLVAVKECLRLRMQQMRKPSQEHSGEFTDFYRDHTTHVIVNQRLAKGENDAFLRHLLMLEYYLTEEGGPNADLPKSPLKLKEELDANEQKDKAAMAGTKFTFDPDDTVEHDTAVAASEKARSMLSMAEDAYDAMVTLLPKVPLRERLDTEGSDPFFGIDTQHVVPDLLPPCTSANGDATTQFFRACLGEVATSRKPEEVDDSPSSDATALPPLSDTSALQNGEAALPKSTTSTSVFKNMFSGMTRTKGSPSRSSTLGGVFGGKRQSASTEQEKKVNTLETSKSVDSAESNDEYSVVIDREMLGLTVENVLERTVVRTVLAGGAAKKSGAKVGSLIVKVGNVETKNLTHFETIDELRQSIRPLKLYLRPISSAGLRSAREEMGRLIRGGGFGSSLPLDQDLNEQYSQEQSARKPTKVEAFSQVLHQRWNGDGSLKLSKKEQALLKAGEKLVWILTLLVIGLEREAATALPTSLESSAETPSRRHASHSAEEYADSAKSVSKVLYDFIKLSAQTKQDEYKESAMSSLLSNHTAVARKKKLLPPPPPSGRGAQRPGGVAVKSPATIALLRIGDVLHRTRTFLADPSSPPAAMLRGEVIAFLCDVLDIDSDMELSEEEAVLAGGGGAGGINDLGSAGSLLKLIILNCSMMRSPECAVEAKKFSQEDTELAEEQRRRFGLKRQSSVLDIHRFHAGNRFLAVVHRLAASRSISARVTACSLGPVLWGHLDFPHQLQLRGVITRALHDVDVLVRKSTAAVLHEIAELVFDSRAVPWLVLMCERAMTDPEPQLRAAAMTLTWHLSEHLPNAFLGDASQGSRSVRRLPTRNDPTFAEVYLLQCKLLPVATRLAEDRSPAVRLAVAAQCDRLCSALGDHWYRIIIDVLQALLGDSDERVRGEAILCVPRLAEIILVSTNENPLSSVGVLQALLPISIKLQKDLSVDVRVALATAAGELLTLLVGLESQEEISSPTANDLAATDAGLRGYKKHVDETLVPLLQKLLHDNVPEVTSAALRAVTNASRGNVREIRAHKKSMTTDDDNMSLSSFQSHEKGVFAKALSKSSPPYWGAPKSWRLAWKLPNFAFDSCWTA